MPGSTFADFGLTPGVADDLVALGVVVFALLVPIISILCKHQLRMASMLRQNPSSAEMLGSRSVSEEVQELRSIVAQQALAVDSIASAQRELVSEIRAMQNVSERIGS